MPRSYSHYILLLPLCIEDTLKTRSSAIGYANRNDALLSSPLNRAPDILRVINGDHAYQTVAELFDST